ncbi:MAG: thiamine pyrophosphate-binding protein [Candidatus Harrisonbacteria bacterium]|nr:thiamine pyrophosphate-binding protein [Candidatus Harrisonbacteria bacterium]
MKLSDYVIDYLYRLGITHIFAISGHGNLHLIDSLGRHPNIAYVSTQHEQAAATAAEGYAKATGNIGAAIFTTGPGGTNAVSGVAAAWLDSVPCIYISGQVNVSESIRDTRVRQFGVQEINIVDIVTPITKYAVTVTDPNTIAFHLQKAAHLATSGRPGPVWLAIPLDISHAEIAPEQLKAFIPDNDRTTDVVLLARQIKETVALLRKAERPILLAGAGIKRARAEKVFSHIVETLGIPVLCTYSGADLIHHNHPLYVGRPGVNGTRGPNFAVQNADLLLAVGTRLNTTQTSSRPETYARAAKKIVVDIDEDELKKCWVAADIAIRADAKLFLNALSDELKNFRGRDIRPWMKRCAEWKKNYSPVLPEYLKLKHKVNSFVFIDALSDAVKGSDLFIHDMGSSFSCTMQTWKVKRGQYVSSNYGLANMGYFLPACIGAWFGRKKKQRVVALCGDGGMQMTIGELQTIAHYKVPLKIFILNNHCYLTIKHSQLTYFNGRFVDSTPESGYSAPDFLNIANAYGLHTASITNQKNLEEKIKKVLAMPGAVICDVLMPDDQPLIPKLTAKVVRGKFITHPLEDMYPLLPRKEFLKNMDVKPLDE